MTSVMISYQHAFKVSNFGYIVILPLVMLS